MEKENIALIELGGSHDECLYSQVLFLKKYGFRIHLILFRDHLERMDKWDEVDNWKTFEPISGTIDKWKLVLGVRSYLRKNGIRNAVINTAEGNIIRELTLLPLKGIKYTGLIHLSRKLWSSSSQRFINRKIKKYFVLADFIAENLDLANPSLKISYFYPVYFPENSPPEFPENKILKTVPGKTQDKSQIKTQDKSQNKIEDKFENRNLNEFLVTIPGAVDNARRDYSSLMDEIVSAGIPEGIRFILLGRTTGPDGKMLVKRIHKEGLEKYFTWFEGFVDNRTFYDHLSVSGLILPLITPGSLDYSDYLKYKITGTYNLAWGFKIPMLMHESMSKYEIFKKTSLFYETGQMLSTLKNINHKELESIHRKIAEMRDFNLEVQADRYINFIKG